MKRFALLLSIVLMSVSGGGCALGLAAGAGAVTHEEFQEARDCGDNFDPLEDIRGAEDGCN